MNILSAKPWLALALATALAAGGIGQAAAAPIAAIPASVLDAQSSVTDVRYRRHYGGGAIFAGALGALALGAVAAAASNNDYYDDPYYDGYSGAGYYPGYAYETYPAYEPVYYRYRRAPHHYGYYHARRHHDRWHHSNRVGRNW